MTNNKVFLDIAKEDLEASKVLLKEHFYPHAIFFFGQSVEKTCKYLMLRDGIITADQLNTKISHDSGKVFTIYTDFIINKISDVTNHETIDKSSDDHLLSEVLNPDNFINDLKSDTIFFQNLRNGINKLDDKKIDHYLNMMKLFSTNIKFESKYSNFFNLEPKVVVDWLLKYSVLDDETKNEIKKNLNDESYKEKYYEKIKKIQMSTHEDMRIQQILMTLAVLFSSYAVDTRYPNNTLDELPSTRFNASTYIIKKLGEFYPYLEKAIEFLKSK